MPQAAPPAAPARDLTPPRAPGRRGRGIAATIAAFALLLTGLPTAAHAAPTEPAGPMTVSGGTLEWKLKDSWYKYILQMPHEITPAPAADGRSTYEPVTGTVDPAAESVSVSAGGATRYQKWFDPSETAPTIDVEFSNLRVEYADGHGTVTADAVGNVGTVPDGEQRDIHLIDLTSAEFDDAGNGTVSVTLNGVFPRGVGDRVIGFVLYEGQEMSPLTLTLTSTGETQATATSTSLSASPSQGAVAGKPVTFTAKVTPEAEGSVRFSSSDGDLGEAAVSRGSASITTSTLAVGEHDITAEFTPADAAAFAASRTTLAGYPVVSDSEPVITTQTSLAAPTGPVRLGDDVELTATVSPADAQGEVRFTAASEQTGTQSLVATATVENGVAKTTTSALVAGGNSIVAEFVGADVRTENSTSTAKRLGVVDLSNDEIPTVGAHALPISGATASWTFSTYAHGWNFPWKAVDGPITIEQGAWKLTEGAGESDGDTARITFPGTVRNNTWGYWSEYKNPELVITSEGTGFWTADFRSYCGGGGTSFCAVTPAEDIPEFERTVILTFSSVDDLAGPGAHNEASVNFDWEGSTATGTWAEGKNSGFHNQFLWKVDPLERGYYHASGTEADPRKPATPLEVSFDWPAKAATELGIEIDGDDTFPLGTAVPVNVRVQPADASGTIALFATSEVTGVERQVAEADADGEYTTIEVDGLEAGGHALRAVFTPADPSKTIGSEATLDSHLGVADMSRPEAPVFDDQALTGTGASARWQWSEYSTWNPMWVESAVAPATVDGTTHVLSEGTITATGDTARITFPGAIRMSSYPGHVNGEYGSWTEISELTLTMDRNSGGTLSGVVRASETEGWDTAPAAGTEVILATVSSIAGLPEPGEQGDATVEFDFAGTVAAGTWATGHADAWHNSFVSVLPEGIRPFYFNSGLNIDGRKAPLPMQVSFTWPKQSDLTPPVEGGETDGEGGTGGTGEQPKTGTEPTGTGVANTGSERPLLPLGIGVILLLGGAAVLVRHARSTPRTEQ